MVINFTKDQTRKLELYTLWLGKPQDDKEAIADILIGMVDDRLAEVRAKGESKP